jgi:predicted enzyme related to lactoylglutathione lyase
MAGRRARRAKRYIKLNHLLITARDVERSRDWYVKNLGLSVEFQVPEVGFVALQDDGGFGFLLAQGDPGRRPGRGTIIHFEVEDVDARYRRMRRRGISFVHPPKQTKWGYGPELHDPDGYVLRLFDYRSITD